MAITVDILGATTRGQTTNFMHFTKDLPYIQRALPHMRYIFPGGGFAATWSTMEA